MVSTPMMCTATQPNNKQEGEEEEAEDHIEEAMYRRRAKGRKRKSQHAVSPVKTSM